MVLDRNDFRLVLFGIDTRLHRWFWIGREETMSAVGTVNSHNIMNLIKSVVA